MIQPDKWTIPSNPSFLLPFLFLYPSSCRCGLCTGRVGTLYRGRDGSSVRVRSRGGGRSCWCSNTTRRRAGVRHLLNQRTIKCLEATEEDGRMSFELQTLCVEFLRSSIENTGQNTFAREIRTATSSVILRTSLPSEDLHFTLYRVYQGSSEPSSIFARARARYYDGGEGGFKKFGGRTFLGDLVYKFSAAS